MGIFSGMRDAKPSAGGTYVQPGKYLARVNAVKMVTSTDPKKKGAQFYCVELLILESKQTDENVAPNGVDSEPAWLCEYPGDYPELSRGNIKNFGVAAFGALAISQGEEPPDSEDIGDEEFDLSIDESNPLAGVFVAINAFHKDTKKGGKFTRVDFSIPEDLEEVVEKYAA